MRSVCKYEMATAIEMPKGARILYVGLRLNKPWIWALVNPDAEQVSRRFRTFADGESFSEASVRCDYVGTYVLPDGSACHVVEIV